MNFKFTITVIVGAVLAVFVLFNRGPIDVKIVFFPIQTSIGGIIIWSFIIGILYTGFMAFFNGIKLRDVIKKQKKEIENLKQ